METLIKLVYAPWPWYIVGPLMGSTIPLLLFGGNKMLGVSSSLRHLCAIIPNQIPYFRYDLWKGTWNVIFAIGVAFGAAPTYHYLYRNRTVAISEATKNDLLALGLNDLSGLMPMEIFALDNLFSFRGLLFTLVGGFLVGFGVRYAGGCTSGHGFMGLSQLSLSSAIAILAFFVGGIIATHLLLPFII